MHPCHVSQSEKEYTMSNNVNGFTFMHHFMHRLGYYWIIFCFSVQSDLHYHSKVCSQNFFELALLKEINTFKDALNDQIILVTKGF